VRQTDRLTDIQTERPGQTRPDQTRQDRQTDRQTDRRPGRQTYSQTYIHTIRQADRQADRQAETDRQADRHTYIQTDRQTDRQADRETDSKRGQEHTGPDSRDHGAPRRQHHLRNSAGPQVLCAPIRGGARRLWLHVQQAAGRVQHCGTPASRACHVGHRGHTRGSRKSFPGSSAPQRRCPDQTKTTRQSGRQTRHTYRPYIHSQSTHTGKHIGVVGH